MSKSLSSFLKKINQFKIKQVDSSGLSGAKTSEIISIKDGISKLLEGVENNKCKLICRGEKKERIKDKFQDRLNSNDSLFDGLFLVGDKAKNYLNKASDIPHPINNINDSKENVCNWIFDFYSQQTSTKIVDLDYFKTPENKQKFASSLRENKELIDCYLFEIHTINSDSLVNYVSGTTDLSVAQSMSNDLIIIYWTNDNNNHLSIDKYALEERKLSFEKHKLPPVSDSNYPLESEVALKGCIFPHYIFGVYDSTENAFIPNPALLNVDYDWIENGFSINQENFVAFIKSTRYKRFLTLVNDTLLEEKSW